MPPSLDYSGQSATFVPLTALMIAVQLAAVSFTHEHVWVPPAVVEKQQLYVAVQVPEAPPGLATQLQPSAAVS
jgi:hypothetical protein